jgi:cytochrome c peroxidase
MSLMNKFTTRWTVIILLLATTVVMMMNACKKSDAGIQHSPTPLSFTIPKGFPAQYYQFTNNPLTQEGFDLGKKLFYDGRLSKDGNFPCASCHQQSAAFATFDHDLSHGFNNQFTTRNAPGLFNMAWHKEMHWDGGINHLEVQPLAPLTAPNEMAEDINNVINKLRSDDKYRQMFKAAYGDDDVNSQRILFALTQFVSLLVSGDSKYDKVKAGKAVFNTYEENGYKLFQAKCTSCHQEPLFTDFSYRNTGLTLNSYLKDYGRMRITNRKEDSLKFKVPSLRNIFQTFPYGHDGRFLSINQMLEHYSTGIQDSPTLDPLLKNKIPLSATEKFYLVQFLATLTDSTFITDKRFAEPK